MKIRLSCSVYHRLLIFATYLMVMLVQLYWWPTCEVSCVSVQWVVTSIPAVLTPATGIKI